MLLALGFSELLKHSGGRHPMSGWPHGGNQQAEAAGAQTQPNSMGTGHKCMHTLHYALKWAHAALGSQAYDMTKARLMHQTA